MLLAKFSQQFHLFNAVHGHLDGPKKGSSVASKEAQNISTHIPYPGMNMETLVFDLSGARLYSPLLYKFYGIDKSQVLPPSEPF